MTAPDFEIDAKIRAKQLRSHAPPDPRSRTEGEGVTLARDEQRSGVPPEIEPGGRYSDVDIAKRIVGETQQGEAAGSD